MCSLHLRAICAIALVLAVPRLARAEGRFAISTLAVPGDLIDVATADLDGDGKNDLLAVYRSGTEPHVQRVVGIFWNQGHQFAAAPDVVVQLPPEACAFDVGDVDEQSGAELLIATSAGVEARSFRGRAAGEARVLVHEPTLFLRAAADDLPRVRMLQDVQHAGSHELLVPGLSRLGVYKRDGGAYTLAAAVEVSPKVEYSENRNELASAPGMETPTLIVKLPRIQLADVDGDGLNDLVLTQQDHLQAFRQLPGMTFHAQPDIDREFGVRTAEEIASNSGRAGLRVLDLDGDGVADVFARKQTSKGLTSASSTEMIFFGHKGGGFGAKPDQQVTRSGASFDVDLLDLTGDGRPDLLAPSINFGIWAFVKMLTSRSAKIKFSVYPFTASRKFAEKPAAERDITMHLDLSGGNQEFPAGEVRGDFNGDGRRDLVMGTDDDELSIFLGGGNEVFSDDAAETVKVRAVGQARAVQLGAPKGDDLLLISPMAKGHKGEILVLLNQGKW